MKPFTPEEAQEAIQKRIECSGVDLRVGENVIQSIVERTGGHPYLIMFTMYELLTILKDPRNIHMKSFEKTWPVIEKQLADTIFLQKFQSASDKEKELTSSNGRVWQY